MEKVNLAYHSPHKFRHGFAVYSLKHAKDISQLKAISQNLMHENISITDGIYGGLSDADIKEQITSLTCENDPLKEMSKKELLLIIKKLINDISE